jgi:hypothetical protein
MAPDTLRAMEFEDIRYELVAIATIAAALPCSCPPAGGPLCLAHRAAAAIDTMTTRGLRMHRWRHTTPQPHAVVHVAGDVVDGLNGSRRQACSRCGLELELERDRVLALWDVGALVAIQPPWAGYHAASVPYPAHGGDHEDPCTPPFG